MVVLLEPACWGRGGGPDDVAFFPTRNKIHKNIVICCPQKLLDSRELISVFRQESMITDLRARSGFLRPWLCTTY